MSNAIKVFVSSTFNDLKQHRDRVIRQLRAAGFHVDPMEDWPSDATEPTKFCPERVRGCQLCILLVGFRRGWVPEPNGANRSITQMEYDEAIRLGIDVLPLMLADDVTDWPTGFDERKIDTYLEDWRESVRPQAGNERFHFRADPNTADVLPAVARWQQRQKERERLADYLKCVADAHKTINFLGLPTFKENPDVEIGDLFVEPALATLEASPDRDPKDWVGVSPLFDSVVDNPQLIVLGDPGTGKSTLVNWIVYQLARPEPNRWKARLGEPIPLPFILRDLGIGRGITWDALLDKFLAGPAHNLLKKDQLLQLLEDGDAMFFLDGLDEIGDVKTREDLRDTVHDGIEKYPSCRWLLTSRIVGYDEVSFHEYFDAPSPRDTGVIVRVLDLRYAAPFDESRIEEFARKWYAIRETDPFKVKRHSLDLVEAIHRDTDTLRLGRIPNLLTMMALVHRQKAMLPHGKALLYNYVAEAYLETIEKFRKLPTGPDTLRDKKRWLGRVAFEMQLRRAAAKGEKGQANAIVVDGDTLRGWLNTAMTEPGHVPDPDDPVRFLDRVRKRSGLMIERSPDLFAFTHLSFQEYFAAVYLKERIATPTWLRGKGIAAGTSPADLQEYVKQTLWQVALVFLFELIAEEAPDWKDDVREAVFGTNWEAVDIGSNDSATATVLLARLADNPHVNWEVATRAAARTRGLDWTVALQRIDGARANTSFLRAFLRGEPDLIRARLETIADHWARAKCAFLNLDGTGVVDLSPLSGMTGLQGLYLSGTGVVEVGPLSRLSGLQRLDLSGTEVVDLAPISSMSGLQELYLDGTGVVDLSPLFGLSRLQDLSLENTGVVDVGPVPSLSGLKRLFLKNTKIPDEEVKRLKLQLPKLSIRK